MRIDCPGNGRDRLLPRPAYGGLIPALILILLVVAACSDDQGEPNAADEVPDPGEQPEDDLAVVNRVADLARLITGPDAEEIRGRPFEIEAWVSPSARTSGLPDTPPQGCPIVPEKQDWISDDPIQTQFEAAGASLPNSRVTQDLPVLRLVVPYQLGFIEIPERGRFRGYVLDDDHAGCPGSETLFVLEEVVEPLPADQDDSQDEIIEAWNGWSHEESGVVLEYPQGWEIEERETDVSTRIRFVGPDEFRSIRLEIQPEETFWHPNADGESAQPEILLGERQEPAIAGPARARLVDDSRRTGEGGRELRLVFNHQGNTISLEMLLSDGAELQVDSLAVFNEIARRLRLEGDASMSDPMDPVLVASDEIGEGPFLSEPDALYVALDASGMTGAEAIEAELVSERRAREATEGACRDFEGSPDGIWLVTVEGTLPSGRDAHRLVYLDAENGNRLCQAEASGVS